MADMINWIRNNRDNAVVASMVASTLAVLISIGGGIATYYMNAAQQTRQTHLEEVVKFNQATDRVSLAGGEFITAINKDKNVEEAKEKIQTETANVILEAERLKSFFYDTAALESYLSSVQEFDRVAQTTSGASDIGAWVASFDKMMEARRRLVDAVNKSQGIAWSPEDMSPQVLRAG
jgi:hypothetical protein